MYSINLLSSNRSSELSLLKHCSPHFQVRKTLRSAEEVRRSDLRGPRSHVSGMTSLPSLPVNPIPVTICQLPALLCHSPLPSTRNSIHLLLLKGISPLPRSLFNKFCFKKCAKTPSGTGRTAAIILGLLNMINVDITAVQFIFLCPTRELSQNIKAVFFYAHEYVQLNIHTHTFLHQ